MTYNETYLNFLSEFPQDHEVLTCDGPILDVKSYKQRVEELAAHLIHLGVKKGSGVGYCIDNCNDNLPLFTAILMLGAYAVPQHKAFPDFVKVQMFQNTHTSVVICDVTQADGLKAAADKAGVTLTIATRDSMKGPCTEHYNLDEYLITSPDPDLPALIATSSGTTGIPKLVSLSQENVGSEIQIVGEMVKSGRADISVPSRSCAAFPFSTSVISIMIGTVYAGDFLAYSADTSPMKYLENIEKFHCDEICSPPAYYEALLLLKDVHHFDLSCVTAVGAGMDFCSPSLLSRMKELFPNIRVFVNGYGLVETCNVFMHAATDLTGSEITGTSTLHLAHVVDNEIKVLDENGQPVSNGETGQLFVKGPSAIKAYLKADNAADAFADGWFRTGDICRKEDDRTITLMGRMKYFIKRGGKQVSPIVVSDAINKTPGVKTSAVVGAPHPLYGEMIWAFVVKEKDSDVSLKDIKVTCKEILPYYMLPDQVTFIDDIPKKRGVGKIDFDTLKEMAAKELEKINF